MKKHFYFKNELRWVIYLYMTKIGHIFYKSCLRGQMQPFDKEWMSRKIINWQMMLVNRAMQQSNSYTGLFFYFDVRFIPNMDVFTIDER